MPCQIKCIWLILFAFVSIAGVSAVEAPLKVIYISGWRTEKFSEEQQIRTLRQIFPPPADVERYAWKADGNFDAVIKNADLEAVKLANRISQSQSKQRENMILVGHSLGGRITIKTMSKLNEQGICIHHGIVLGAALSYDDPNIPSAIQASLHPNIFVYQPNDTILRDQYCSYIGAAATLGNRGFTGRYAPEKLRQICIKSSSSSANHDSMVYISALKRKIDRSQDEPPQPEISGFRHEIKNPEKIPEVPLMKTISEYEGWRIIKPFLSLRKYDLFDPQMRRRAQGSLAEMRQALEDVQKILQRKTERK